MSEAHIGLLQEVRAQQRLANGIDNLTKRYIDGERLFPGQMAKILHLLPPFDQRNAEKEIIRAGSAFWAKWSEFRCGVNNEGVATHPDEPNFYHVVGLLPVVQQFSNFAVKDADKNNPAIVVDLMGGTGNMAHQIAKRRTLAGYILVDGNHRIEKVAEQNLTNLNLPNSSVIIHDLTYGLPERLGENIAQIKKDYGDTPLNLIFVSNWGLTYLPLEPMMRVIEQSFDPNINAGLKTSLALNMLSDGGFDPEVLNRRFGREIVPRKLFTCQIKALKRARAAKPHIVEFGKELPTAVPIWYPKEITKPLTDLGFNVSDVNGSILWNQCTAIRVTGKH